MKEFFTEYKDQIIFIGIVLLCYAVLVWLTKFLAKYISNKLYEKLEVSNFKTVKIIKRILTSLWTILAIMSISYVFLNDKMQAEIKDNFLLILYIGIVLVITLSAGSLAQILFTKQIDEKRLNKEEATNLIFLKYIVVIGIYVVGLLLIVVAFPKLRGLAQTALGGAGVLAVVLGIASQEALGNIVSGMFIIAFKPFKLGDVIKVTDELMGTVYNITLRHTVIKNFQNTMIVIPNAIINKERVTNFTMEDQKICQWIIIGISYDSNIDKAKNIIRSECENHPLLLDNRTAEDKANGMDKVRIKVVGLGDSSVNIRAWVWTKNYDDSAAIRFDLLESIKKRFDVEGIEIPYPHRTIVYKGTDKI
ncbi:MAG: mechanosensitive ion channel family protein [Aestuariibaculum sp.]